MFPHMWLWIGLLTFGCFACSEADVYTPRPTCETAAAVVDSSAYDSASTNDVIIQDVTVTGSCLRAQIQYGGGCGDESFALIDRGGSEKTPEDRFLRLASGNEDNCKALISGEVAFSLESLPVKEDGATLYIEGFANAVTYTPN